MTPLEQAKEAVRRSRDFVPSNGRHYRPDELDQLGRLCAEAVKSCALAGTTIAEMRLLLWQEERAAYRAQLAALARKEVTR